MSDPRQNIQALPPYENLQPNTHQIQNLDTDNLVKKFSLKCTEISLR